MNGEKANMCFTDPPYILDYLNGKKKHGKATEGFGATERAAGNWVRLRNLQSYTGIRVWMIRILVATKVSRD